MISLNKYIFYRAYLFWSLVNRSTFAETQATSFLTLLQGLTIMSFFVISSEAGVMEMPPKYVFLIILILLMGLNWLRFERNFDVEYASSLKNKEKSGEWKLKGWMIIGYTLIVVAVPVSIGILRHNFNLM